MLTLSAEFGKKSISIVELNTVLVVVLVCVKSAWSTLSGVIKNNFCKCHKQIEKFAPGD